MKVLLLAVSVMSIFAMSDVALAQSREIDNAFRRLQDTLLDMNDDKMSNEEKFERYQERSNEGTDEMNRSNREMQQRNQQMLNDAYRRTNELQNQQRRSR